MTSLYEQLGGEPALDAAVDIFYKKVLADPHINHFFTDIDMDAQRAKQKALLTTVFGGPSIYAGRDLRTAHAHLQLEESHFNAVAGHLNSTLEDLSVPDDLKAQVMAIAASTHDDVLNL